MKIVNVLKDIIRNVAGFFSFKITKILPPQKQPGNRVLGKYSNKKSNPNHEILENGNKTLYMTESHRTRVLSIMHTLDEKDRENREKNKFRNDFMKGFLN